MSAMRKDTEEIIQEYNNNEISMSISRAYKQHYKKKITDKVFLPAYKQAMLNHPFLNLEVKIYL